MPITEQTYQQVALEDPEGKWERHCGRLVQKPAMTIQHEGIAWRLGARLTKALDEDAYQVVIGGPRLRLANGDYFVPDVAVFRVELMRRYLPGSSELHKFVEPMLLVVEVWSPSTGNYDVNVKLAAYQQRGDEEIWRLHPIERTLTRWRRQPDGAYAEEVVRGGVVEPACLPGVRVDLDRLFRFEYPGVERAEDTADGGH